MTETKKRKHVPISEGHYEKLQELAKRYRRSNVGQVEYMIDRWNELMGMQAAMPILKDQASEALTELRWWGQADRGMDAEMPGGRRAKGLLSE